MSENLLTVPEVLARLRISKPSLNRRFRDGSIPRTKIGGRTFVRESSLDKFLDRAEGKKAPLTIWQNTGRNLRLLHPGAVDFSAFSMPSDLTAASAILAGKTMT